MRKERPGRESPQYGESGQSRVIELELVGLRDKAVARFALRFNLAPEIARRGYDTEIVSLDQVSFARAYQEENQEVSQFLFEHGLINEAQVQKLRRWAQKPPKQGATVLFQKDGRRIMPILRTATSDLNMLIEHELLHSLSALGFGQGTGFLPSPDRLIRWAAQRRESVWQFNEAATEILRIATDHPATSPKALYHRVSKGKIFVVPAYKLLTEFWLGLLALQRSKGNNPLTLDALAQAYFTNQDHEPILKSLDL